SLLRALSHYAINDLDRTPELEKALYRIFQAHQRGTTHVSVVVRLLNRFGERGEGALTPTPELREMLDRLIVATQLRDPVVGSLARSVRYRCFDQPLIEASRAASDRSVEEHLAYLSFHPDAPDYAVRVDELVISPHPLLELMGERFGDRNAHPAM